MTGFEQLLQSTSAPIYAVDGQGVVVMANTALCDWIGMDAGSVIGRRVGYHSEAAQLTGLCPPPCAFEQATVEATLSTMGRDGKLRHRRGRFLWLGSAEADQRPSVLALLDLRDLTPQQLAATLSGEPTQDQLHRDLRRFRRTHQEPEATALLLGDSPAARLLRSQFDLAVKTNASATVRGPCPADSATLARAIHYAKQDSLARLVPVDCKQLPPEEVLRLIEEQSVAAELTLLLLEANAASTETQHAIAQRVRAQQMTPRVLATLSPDEEARLTPELRTLVGALWLDMPGLAERLPDLPIIVQFFIERANAGSAKQVGGASPEALDQLALYDWPDGAVQLSEAITAAHAACKGAEIQPQHLPTMIRQAVLAASLGPSRPNEIVLDEFLEQIEREILHRALQQTNGNKAEAARLLGLTRQKLYRRLGEEA